jgi:L-amino acid N-acyltransferase YncA
MTEVSASQGLRVRAAMEEDAAAIAALYNQGIEERIATFETELRSAEARRACRDRHVGDLLLPALIAESERPGLWKLLPRIFPFHEAGRALCRKHGFREIGVCEKHAKLGPLARCRDRRTADCGEPELMALRRIPCISPLARSTSY